MQGEGTVPPADYYALLGIPATATLKEIQRAYRIQALSCHPDKVGAGNVQAAAQFHALSLAVEVLTSPELKRTHDLALHARRAREAEAERMGAKRKAARDDLEARERGGADPQRQRQQQEAALLRDAQVRALRQEGVELVRNQSRMSQRHVSILGSIGRAVQEARTKLAATETMSMEDLSVKVKWSSPAGGPGEGGTMREGELARLFARFGPLDHVMLGSKQSAILLFQDATGVVRGGRAWSFAIML